MLETAGGRPHFESPRIDKQEIGKRKRNFDRVLRRLNPDQRGVVTEIVSVFNEVDIYAQYKGNPDKIDGLSTSLGLVGLGPRQTRTVLKYLNLS